MRSNRSWVKIVDLPLALFPIGLGQIDGGPMRTQDLTPTEELRSVPAMNDVPHPAAVSKHAGVGLCLLAGAGTRVGNGPYARSVHLQLRSLALIVLTPGDPGRWRGRRRGGHLGRVSAR